MLLRDGRSSFNIVLIEVFSRDGDGDDALRYDEVEFFFQGKFPALHINRVNIKVIKPYWLLQIKT